MYKQSFWWRVQLPSECALCFPVLEHLRWTEWGQAAPQCLRQEWKHGQGSPAGECPCKNGLHSCTSKCSHLCWDMSLCFLPLANLLRLAFDTRCTGLLAALHTHFDVCRCMRSLLSLAHAMHSALQILLCLLWFRHVVDADFAPILYWLLADSSLVLVVLSIVTRFCIALHFKCFSQCKGCTI